MNREELVQLSWRGCDRMRELAKLDDADFWNAVLQPDEGSDYDVDDPDPDPRDLDPRYNDPCHVCGEYGPCSFDICGNPMYHFMYQPRPDLYNG